MKTKVCLLFGGDSMEREISFLSYKEIMGNIDKDKFDVISIEVPVEKNNSWVQKLISYSPDVVMIAMHGGKGEDGSVQGLLESLDTPYIGSKVLSSAISMDKDICKALLKANNIPVIDWVCINKNDKLVFFEGTLNEIGYPLFVKPNTGGGSIGVSPVNSYEELGPAAAAAFQYSSEIIVEKFIKGKEVACAIIQNNSGIDALNILDIDSGVGFYDFTSKYIDTKKFIDFSALPLYQKKMVKEIGKKAFKTLKCRGIAVVDMIISEEQVYVLEVNTLPGFTSKSIIPKSVSNIKEFKNFLTELIEFEIGQGGF
ncbi:MAG: D-alanine--D-alanine ligase [Clostridiales bacterium]|jgi:D-alanine-D-alanine ligase|nr:D-alanine--D-alanine ligase [Clostridiales bacterium]